MSISIDILSDPTPKKTTTITVEKDAIRILTVEGPVVSDTWISTKDSK
jgi:hypothetical protein